MRLFADRYEIEQRLGAGGMAEVWAARDTRLDRDVAVKILRREIVDSASAQRFTREASAIASVTHRNIVAVYDAGTDAGRPYLVMELVDGVTVRRLLDSGPLPVASAVEIAVGVCDALDAAHRAGIIHRDVKPGNVIRATSGTVKILDFGIAKSLHTDTDPLTETATVVGTSHYLAPERIHGQAADARSDLYSLGCLLYEMLTGFPPFDADHPLGVLHQHLHADPEPIQRHRPGVPAPLVSLVTRLLAKDPRDRPASATQVARTLRTADHDAASTGTSAHPTPTKVYPTPSALEGWVLLVLDRRVQPVLDRRLQPVLDRRLQPVLERWLTRPRTRVLIALAGAAAALYAVVALALWPGDEAAGQAAGRDDTPGLKGRLVSLEPERKPTTTPPPRSERPRPARAQPAARLAQLNRVLDRQINAGNVHPDGADKLRDDLAKIREKHQEGKLPDAAAHTSELDHRLDELAHEGKLTGHAHRSLGTATSRLAAALPRR